MKTETLQELKKLLAKDDVAKLPIEPRASSLNSRHWEIVDLYTDGYFWLDVEDAIVQGKGKDAENLAMVMETFCRYVIMRPMIEKLIEGDEKLKELLKLILKDYKAMEKLFIKLDMKNSLKDTRETIEYISKFIEEIENDIYSK
jgi:hypothetical protein